MDDGTAVIIILYNPSEEDIGNAESVAKTYRGVIVDNSDLPFTKDSKIGRMHYVCNKANKGIAEAQNIGMRIMLRECVSHLVFFDQDSRFGHDYPSLIANEFKSIKKDIPNLAMIGPTVKRKDSGEDYRSAIHKARYAS